MYRYSKTQKIKLPLMSHIKHVPVHQNTEVKLPLMSHIDGQTTINTQLAKRIIIRA